MVGPGQVDPELEEEVAQECTTKYGAVQSVMIFEVTTPGFPPEQAVRIFVEFERVEEATKVGRLSVVNGCVPSMQHASSHEVESLLWKFVRAFGLLQVPRLSVCPWCVWLAVQPVADSCEVLLVLATLECGLPDCNIMAAPSMFCTILQCLLLMSNHFNPMP